jgi:hypothetical protein
MSSQNAREWRKIERDETFQQMISKYFPEMQRILNGQSRCSPDKIDRGQKIGFILHVQNLVPVVEKLLLSWCAAVITIHRHKFHLN